MNNFLELGKEISQLVIDRYEETYYSYVTVDKISSDTLQTIGKELFQNTGMFLDYCRYKYEEKGFDWSESTLNSYDFIEKLVSVNIEDGKDYVWNEDAEVYVSRIDETMDISKSVHKINIANDFQLAVVLNDSRKEYVYISRFGSEYYVEHTNKSFDIESINNVKSNHYVVKCINDIYRDYNCVLEKSKELSIQELSNLMWSYMKGFDRYKNIRFMLPVEYTSEHSKFLDSLIKGTSNLKDNGLKVDNIAYNLIAYYNGVCNRISKDAFTLVSELFDMSVNEIFSEKLEWSDESDSWILKDSESRFREAISDRMQDIFNINNFKSFEVIPKDIEFELINDFAINELSVAIEDGYSEAMGHIELEYFWNKADSMLDMFLREGTLKNLSNEQISHMQKESVDYKDDENMRQMSIRFFRAYLTDILLFENSKNSRLYTRLHIWSIYKLILDNIDKITPHINTMYENGFSFEKLEDLINSTEDFYIPSILSDAVESELKKWIYPKG